MKSFYHDELYTILLIILIFGLSSFAVASGPDVLSVSASGHYFQYDSRTLMLVGDSGTQCVLQDAALDYRRWIDECSQDGLNCIHVWSFMAPRQKADGSVLEERFGYYYPGMMPWVRKTSGPLAFDGGYQWDLQEWDEGDDPSHYWPRLRDLCAYAKAKGMIVGITVFWGWPKHQTDWQWHPFNSINGGPISEIITRYATKVQHISDPGQYIYNEKWQENWSEARKNQWLWEKYCDKIMNETQHYGNVFYVFMDEHSYDEGNGGDHFRRMFQDRGALWVDWEARRKEVDAVFEPLNYDKKTGRNKGGIAGFMKAPARPFMMIEGEPYVGDEVRYAIWTLLIAGGHNIYHDDAGQETPQTGIMGYDPSVTGNDTGSQRRAWSGIASRFFNGEIKNIDAMTPDNSLVGEGDFCLANRGEEYAVYSMPGENQDLRVNLSGLNGKYNYVFHDPRTGEQTASGKIEAGGWVSIKKPSPGDWALHLINDEQ